MERRHPPTASLTSARTHPTCTPTPPARSPLRTAVAQSFYTSKCLRRPRRPIKTPSPTHPLYLCIAPPRQAECPTRGAVYSSLLTDYVPLYIPASDPPLSRRPRCKLLPSSHPPHKDRARRHPPHTQHPPAQQPAASARAELRHPHP